MQLLHTSDLKGRPELFESLARAVGTSRADLLVLGGNLFPDDAASLPDEMGTRQPVYVLETFRPWLNSVLKAHPALHVAMIFGNHDWLSSAQAVEDIAKHEPRLHLPTHDRPVELGGLTLVGYSRTPPTACYVKDFERLDQPGDPLPLVGGARWNAARRRAVSGPAKAQFTTVPSMADELEKLSVPSGPWVFIAAAPPFDTALDRDWHREPVGSKAVRSVIVSHQPLLSLHGHVTSSPDVTGAWQETIGATIAVNVGQHITELCWASIEVDPAARRVIRVEAKRPQ